MQIDIASHIEKLLFLHDSLTIPGFGAFTARPTTALADYAGGTVTPPSKTLTFNENITTDDGLLIQEVSKANSISSEQARHAVETFVSNIQQLLDRREIVTLPGIGRLYKNYVHKIQFLPDAANFNAESFGLPPLQFTPITRSREVVETAIPTTAAGSSTSVASATLPPAPPSLPDYTTAAPASESSGSGVVPMLITLLVLLSMMGIYWIWKNNQRDKKGPSDEVVKVEQPATKTPAPAKNAPASTAAGDPEDVSKGVEESVDKKMQAAREEVEADAGKRECILVVATLQQEANADRLVGMLEKEGYQVYFLRKNGFQVGIQFRYAHLREIQEKIVALQNLTGEQSIWIKKK